MEDISLGAALTVSAVLVLLFLIWRQTKRLSQRTETLSQSAEKIVKKLELQNLGVELTSLSHEVNDIKKYLGDMERRDGVRFGDIEREVTMSGYVMYKRVHENADIFENDDEHVGSAS